MNERLKKIEEYMKSLGYVRKDIIDREVIMCAFKRDGAHTIFFISGKEDAFAPLQAQVRFNSDKGRTTAVTAALHEINKKLIISAVEYENTDGVCEVKLRSHYTGEFQNEAFASWLNVFLGEVEEVLQDSNFRQYF